MENFCKGLVFGMAVGLCVGGVIVAKNKKLSGMVKQKAELVEKKISEVTDQIKEKVEEAGEEKPIDINAQNPKPCDCNTNAQN